MSRELARLVFIAAFGIVSVLRWLDRRFAKPDWSAEDEEAYRLWARL